MSCGAPLASGCPQCGTDLPPEAKFCLSCGHQLAQTQAASVEARLQQYIPRELLEKLETAQASGGMQGERRVVSMLFCDVQGSTAAAEGLDPEEWAEILNDAFEHLIGPVYRYEGTLARLMGDAILAFFGAPIAHEDDPQRAVLAGLDIVNGLDAYREEVKRKWGFEFDVRVGINTGLVVVGEVGSDLRVEYTALGDAINLAARMEQTARPGTVQISGDTHRLVAPLFECESLGSVDVKGKSQPVEAYRVLHLKDEPGRLRGIEGLDSPLIGRDSEMTAIRGVMDRLREGRGEVVSVMGEAGLGKSRLMAELYSTLSSQGIIAGATPTNGVGANGPQIAWYEGRSLSYETTVPYAPFIGLLNKIFGLTEGATDEHRYGRVQAYVGNLLPDQVDQTAPYIATMLGINLTGEEAERIRYLQPPQVRTKVFTAVRTLFEQMAAHHPLMLVFEDLHWVDAISLDLIEQLLTLTDRHAVCITTLFRPHRQEPSWHFDEVAKRDFGHRYTSVLLEALDENDSRELVSCLLRIDGLPESVRSLILNKAEGNPFFVEEVIRSLLDSKLVVRDGSSWRATRAIENIGVPDTLAGVIVSRLDQLDESSRYALQNASVLGREFDFETLCSVHESKDALEDALADLQRRELVREKSRVPQRVYSFKHALTQETTYSSLLLSRRRHLHKRVAEVIESTYPDRVTDVARHFLEARESELALPHLVESGERAAGAYSTPDAITAFTTALGILETVEDAALSRRAYEGLGGALTFAGQFSQAIENYQTMALVAQKLGDMPMQVSALNKIGFVNAVLQDQVPEAEQRLSEAERLARACDDLPGLAEMHMTYCYLRVPAGEFDDAVDHLSESAELGQSLGLEEPKLFGLVHTANTLTYMTEFEDAWKVVEQARRTAEELGNGKWLSELLGLTIPWHRLRNGDLDAAEASAQEGEKLAGRIGATLQESFGAHLQGQVAWMRGEYEAAIECDRRALRAGEEAGLAFLQVDAYCGLGVAYLDVGGHLVDEAEKFNSEALRLMDMPLGWAGGSMACASIGLCRLIAGDVDGAQELFQRGLTMRSGMKYLARPMLLVGSGLVAAFRGQLEDATGLIAEAREFAESRGMKHLFPLMELGDGNVSLARGDAGRALKSFEHGAESASAMKMRPFLWQLKAGAAKAFRELDQPDQAKARLTEAREVVAEIAGIFQDEHLKNTYLATAGARIE